jgi:hypothetical protein
MSNGTQYVPGAAFGARVDKHSEEKWALILIRELRYAPEKVWQALTDPVQLSEWAPFDVDGNLDIVGATVNLQWTGTQQAFPITVTRVEAPRVLEYGDIRWQLEPVDSGTRLTLWTNIDRRFVSWGAAGWHISFDVLDRLLSGAPIGRIAGEGARQFDGWQRLVKEYTQQFAIETPAGST